MSLTDFWTKNVHVYKSASAVAIRMCTLFVFIDLHAQKWLFLLCIKTTHRNKLKCEADLRRAFFYKVTN